MSGTVTAVVVDDSGFMRATITDILESGGIRVVAEASDGAKSVAAVREHEPDVVTMDVEMPGMGGIEAVERIMAERPTPILMLSAHTGADSSVTFEALQRGAVDFFEKPRGEVSVGLSRSEGPLVDAVREVAAATPTGPEGGRTEESSRTSTAVGALPERPTLVIGASTGGPNVVERTLAALPAPAFRVLVVQHMPASFTGGFADRLDERSDYDVSEAGNGDRIGRGEALVAPGDSHLEVTGYRSGRLRVGLTDDPEKSVQPAIDVTMTSAAERIEDSLVGAVLTGMGDDGSAGVKAIKRAGGHVVVQDEDSSAVFGMPKRAIETGSVDTVRPAPELAEGIVEVLGAGGDGTTAGGTEVPNS
jgi:two-component system chemotaxis response regulator CheB